jgi:glutamine synthetase type III
MVEMAETIIYPAAMSYLSELTSTATKAKKLGIDVNTSMMAAINDNAGA